MNHQSIATKQQTRSVPSPTHTDHNKRVYNKKFSNMNEANNVSGISMAEKIAIIGVLSIVLQKMIGAFERSVTIIIEIFIGDVETFKKNIREEFPSLSEVSFKTLKASVYMIFECTVGLVLVHMYPDLALISSDSKFLNHFSVLFPLLAQTDLTNDIIKSLTQLRQLSKMRPEQQLKFPPIE